MLKARLSIFALALAALAAQVPIAHACILEFRSTDWQVAQSPLVVVATVAKVTPAPLSPEDTSLFSGGLTKPSTAAISITQILKGPADTPKNLTVASGPIRSCNPYPVHLPFTPGKSYIFILTPNAPPPDGYQLAWAGSLLDISDLPAVQNSITRMSTWRNDYLSRIQKDSPQILSAAKILDAQLTAASKSWPVRSEDSLTPSELLHGISDDPATKAASDSTLALLNSSTPTIIETALALDFARPTTESEGSGNWSHHPLWAKLRLRYTESHAAEILALNQSEWARLLASPPATTTPEQLEKYFSRLSDQTPTLSFPFPTPDPIPNLHGDTLTTDFLLRAQNYDRGDLYFNYGMQPDPLATLNPKRAAYTLTTLMNSSDTHLQWAATTAIFEMPSDDFCALLLSRLIAGAPLPLADLQADSPIEKHVLAVIDYATAHASAETIAKIWSRLAAAECFTPAIRARAAAASPQPTAYLQAADTYLKSSHSAFASP